jgi:hypothetical protein
VEGQSYRKALQSMYDVVLYALRRRGEDYRAADRLVDKWNRDVREAEDVSVPG